MRKRGIILGIFLTVVMAATASGQHYVGVKGGYGGASGRLRTVYGVVEGKMDWGKYNAGVMWKYYSDQKVVGGIAAELEYQMRGYTAYDQGYVVSDSTNYFARTRTVSSVTLPLIWQPHIYLVNRRVRAFLNLGVTLTYNLGMGDTFTVTEYTMNGEKQTSSSVTEDYKMQRARDNRWNYGFCAGGGFGVLMGRCEIFAEARYYYGMSDIVRNQNKYIFNEGMLRSELDNLFVTVGVFFRLGKGGIKELPLGRRVAPPPRDDDFRNIKLPY